LNNDISSLPRMLNAWQAFAWRAWLNPKVVPYFADPDGEQRWDEAVAGRWPKKFGKPVMKPALAQVAVMAAISSGELSAYRKVDP